MYTIDELKAKTKQKGWTYLELSKRSSVPENSIKQIFRGRVPNPRYDTICAIVRALGLDNQTEKEKPEYVLIYEALSERHQTLALGYMQGLLLSEGKEISSVARQTTTQIKKGY